MIISNNSINHLARRKAAGITSNYRNLQRMEYFKIGKLVAVHGLKGELVCKHTLGKKTTLKGLKTLFVEERKQAFLPWFIESVRAKNEEELFLKLETIDTKEAAQRVVQKEIWLPEEDFKKYAAKSAPANLLGYTIIDNQQSLGEILEVIEQPQQLLCRIDINGNEVLIPIHEQSLQKVDHRKRQVFVTLPDGLLEIYL